MHVLNEVLSITAQEYAPHRSGIVRNRFLNEVLSITAQEWRRVSLPGLRQMVPQ